MMLKRIVQWSSLVILLSISTVQSQLTEYVNPFFGTAPLTNPDEIGYTPPEGWRVWAGLTYPGSSVPNAMVQLSPITEFGSGAGYEYEDDKILAFTHTNKGHWNLCHIPVLPVAGEVDPGDFASEFSHDKETASPGYYQVLLERYNINVELTTTLRCGYHKYTYADSQGKKLIVNLAVSNERVRDWEIKQENETEFSGRQQAGGNVYFYARTNHKISSIERVGFGRRSISVVDFADSSEPLEMAIGLSFVSVENARDNLSEVAGKSFEQVRAQAAATWEKLLGKIRVSGGTDKQKQWFYTSLYRSFLWPALRSDINGDFRDASGHTVNKGFRYYTIPSLWDDYRNKLVLMATLTPDVANDSIKSLIDDGEKRGFMPTFFHGDHAAPYIAGCYLRGLRDYDVKSAYDLLLRNATVEGGTRPHIAEYMAKGYISTPVVENPHVETKAKAGVTKTLEYAYDDYAVALLARELGDTANYEMLMERSKNYKNVFDVSTGLMRGRLDNGQWVEPFDSEYPYYEYMYREANAWQSTFFAPHDTKGLIALYASPEEFESQLDKLFTIPWNPQHIARNISVFIGQYCHGNQPDHSFPYLYTFVGRQEKSQQRINEIMDRLYGMGEYGLAMCGMDDAGEMSAWYVYAAMGFYPYSPADPSYIISVPVFDKIEMQVEANTFTVVRKNNGLKISRVTCDNEAIEDYFLEHESLLKNKVLVIETE